MDLLLNHKQEAEIEMAKILYSFIEMNKHLFSNAVLDAANKLFEEVQKMELINDGQ